MSNNDSSNYNFNRTKQHLRNVANRRNQTRQKRGPSNSRNLKRRPKRQRIKTNTKITSDTANHRKNRRTVGYPNYKSSSHMIKGSHTQLTNHEFQNKISSAIPFKENYTYESEFPDIKPPVTTTSRTRFGECLVIAGTESFEPVTVETSASNFPTQAGDIIAALAINPQLLAATRLAKLAENYTSWYPRRLVIEYVPQGSALDVGALISIPVMDPEDNFLGSRGNDAIRRALAYERSVSFNIFDKPQFMLPETEEDEPFFVTAGQNARQEISHIWYCMAQSSFPARDNEKERILGWFKLHYVIELYEPKIPRIDVPRTQVVTYPVGSMTTLSFFGTATALGDPMCTDKDLTIGGGGPIVPHMIQIEILEPIIADPSATAVRLHFDGVDVELLSGTIVYARLTADEEACYHWYSNYSDLFNQSNQGLINSSINSTGFTRGAWRATELVIVG